ncbi:MAG: Bax inhibitor-1/YccA family protein [Candidatus Synoicihabitans palmerolidicus]|nr:Bax inhibitor-1/YccA family protein [Candidatus Synoicihabitans palmerolidicus]
MCLETYFVNASWAPSLVQTMIGGQFSWLIVLGSFMAVAWIADKWARSDISPARQMLGLGLFVVAEAFIFLPLLFIATFYSSPDVIPMAGIITLLLFASLTATAFITRRDFSFMRGVLTLVGFIALGVIVCSMLFGFNLGLLFSAFMVLFVAGSILYSTSNIIHHYRTDQHVSAALSLFSGVMLLLWYVLRILMRR